MIRWLKGNLKVIESDFVRYDMIYISIVLVYFSPVMYFVDHATKFHDTTAVITMLAPGACFLFQLPYIVYVIFFCEKMYFKKKKISVLLNQIIFHHYPTMIMIYVIRIP